MREHVATVAAVRYIAKPHNRGSPALLLASSLLSSLEASLPAGTRRLFDPWPGSNPAGATTDLCEMFPKKRKVILPGRLRRYRKNRWLRGLATPDSCD